jgi:1-acyl-sn-glycerol-3-phosphate acyltransferase
LLYGILKITVRLAMKIFCRAIIVNNRELLNRKGPLLLASNHPNSFLDAVILDILFKQPVWALARGDAFHNAWISSILKALKILPVYRVSEGSVYLNNNYETFNACRDIFRNKGIVLIFSEGQCVNEWRLRPLRKGTARLAIRSWEENIPLDVLPVGINYSSFRRFGKNVIINFGSVISQTHIPPLASEGARYQAFNHRLKEELSSLVYEIQQGDQERKKNLLVKNPSRVARLIYSLPAGLGWLVHLPLYLPVQKFTQKKTWNSDYFDSILAATLLLAYPVYLLLISFCTFLMTGSYYSFLLLLLLPFTAWCYVQVKGQLDH